MIFCDVVFLEPVSLEELSSEAFHSTVCAWALNHGSVVEGDFAGEMSYGGTPKGVYHVRSNGCYITPDEIDDYGALCIGSYKAYITNFKSVPSTPQKSIHESLKEFLNEVFESNNFSDAERNSALNMTLRQFIDTWDNILQTGTMTFPSTEHEAHQLGVTKSFLLSWPLEVVCPHCHVKGGIKIVDGTVQCSKCYTMFGDVDDIPE